MYRPVPGATRGPFTRRSSCSRPRRSRRLFRLMTLLALVNHFSANRREGLAMPDVGMVRRFGRLLSRLQRDSRANVAATFAIALVPLIASIGCAIDYSMATRIKAKLQSSADAASV